MITNMNNYVEIKEPENNLDEVDVLGLLLQKYIPDSVYDIDRKSWTVPNKT